MTSKKNKVVTPEGVIPMMPDVVRTSLEVHRRVCRYLDDQMGKNQPLVIPPDLVVGYRPEAAEDCLSWLLRTVQADYEKSAAIRYVNLFEAVHELITGQARCARTEPFRKMEGGVLRFFTDRPIPEDKTTVVLDATGTKAQYDAIFGPDRVVEHRIPDVAHSSRIIQIVNSSYSRKYLNYDLAQKQLASQEPSRPNRMVERIVRSIVSRHTDARFALITYQAYLKRVAALFPPGLQALYFGNQRGSNRLEDCGVLVIIGIPRIPATDIRHEAERMFGHEVQPEEPTEAWVTLCGDNRSAWVKTLGYKSRELEIAYEAKVGAELEQAVGRSRYLTGGKAVYVLANHPLGMPGVTLVDAHELIGDLRVRKDSLYARVEQRVRAVLSAGQPVEVKKIAAGLGCSRQAVSRHWSRLKALMTLETPSLPGGSETGCAAGPLGVTPVI